MTWAYGIEPGDAQRRYDEISDMVMRSLETGIIGPPGSTANGADMPIRTRQAPHPPFGSLSYAEARSSLARFAAEVAPALRELDPA